MSFDFSSLYHSEAVEVTDRHGQVVFEVVVQEVSYGAKADAQAMLMSEIDIPVAGSKKTREQQLKASMKAAMKNGVSARMSINEEIAAIVSWTDTQDNDIAITADNLRKLPDYMAKQIVEAIERLNPDLDDDFRDDSGSEDS